MKTTDATTKMTKEQLIGVLLAPHVSEKGVRNSEAGQIVFRVRPDASKPDVKAAVEMLFEVKVEGVQILNQSGKKRVFGRNRIQGRRSDFKKAYVRLAQGQTIDFANGAKS